MKDCIVWLNSLDYQLVILVEFEDMEEVRLHALDHLLTHNERVEKVYNKHN